MKRENSMEGKKPSRKSSKISAKAGERIEISYREALSYQSTAPKTALWKARETAESICKQIFSLECSPVPPKSISKCLTIFRERRVLPPHIGPALETVRRYGNVGAHDLGTDAENITPDYVRTCLYSLSTLVQWYLKTYHPARAEEFIAQGQAVYVFISYHHQEPDITLAHDFAKALQQARHGVFIDTGIRWGTNWVKEIRNALKRSDYVLLLLSPEAATSVMALEEIAIAKELAFRQNGSPMLLPIRVNYPFNKALPYHLEFDLSTIAQETWDSPDDTPRLSAGLLNAIAEQHSWPEKVIAETAPVIESPTSPQPHVDPRYVIHHPGGAIDVESYIYIERKADREVFQALNSPRAMVTIRGARQTGKTSLVMRMYAAMQTRVRVMFLDFQVFPFQFEHIQSLALLWRTIAARIAQHLHLKEWTIEDWNENIEYDENIVRFFEQVRAEQHGKPILLCFDEVDRVFSAPASVKAGFFASIRAFYNDGALIDSVWRNVRWLLVTSSEPRFFIEDLSQSPFNIGIPVELSMFTPEEIATLARRQKLTLSSSELDDIMIYLGGHPYLTHLLLYHLVQTPESRDRLFDPHTAGGGIFRDHLHRYLIQFQREQALVEAMQSIIGGSGCKDVKIVNRFSAAGLVRRNQDGKIVPLCELYRDFFSKELQ